MITFLVAVAACLITNLSAVAQPVINDPNLAVSEVASGLSLPTTMAFIDADDILVLQKNDGKVKRIHFPAGVLQVDEVLDVNVDAQSERGLLGIAVHPNFATTAWVYLFYTENGVASDGMGSGIANRVYRYTWNGSGLTSPLLIVDLPLSPGPSHNGGVIAFGPDGKLYVMIGDLNRNGQLQNNAAGAAPDDTSVILRLNDDGTVPKNNPFFSQGGNVAKYYAYGIRNSFGMAFDPITGKLWDTENGTANYDEINLVERGFNSGWTKVQGPMSRDLEGDDVSDLFSLPRARYADPMFSWFESIGVTAIAFLNSAELGSEYENNAFVGDYVFGNLYRFELNDSRNGFVVSGGLGDRVADNANERNDTVLGAGFGSITDLKVGPDGLLYVVSISDGAIYVVHPTVEVAESLPDAVVGASYNADLNLNGGTAPYTIAVIDGSLPAGLNIAGEAISGTPTESGRSSFTLQISDDSGAYFIRSFKIKAYRALKIVTNKLHQGRVNKKYAADLDATGGKKPRTWSLMLGNVLPAGLTLDSATGKITGNPTAAGTGNVTFVVTDALGVAAQKSFILTIE
jgi:glucose/arabinose dehydrogenase